MKTIKTYKHAIKILKKKGSKIALQTKHDSPFIFAEKRDFISELKQRIEDGTKIFTDYDGNLDAASWDEEQNLLLLHAGSF
jgi:hypothetical protein